MEEKNSAGMFPASGRGSDIEGFSSIQRFVLFRGYIRGAEQALRCRGQENPLSVFNKISKIHSHQSYNEPVSVNLRKIDFPKEQQAVAVNRRCSPLHTHKRTAHHSLSQNNWFFRHNNGKTSLYLSVTYHFLYHEQLFWTWRLKVPERTEDSSKVLPCWNFYSFLSINYFQIHWQFV